MRLGCCFAILQDLILYRARRAFATLNVDILRIAMTHGQFVDSAIERFEKAMKMNSIASGLANGHQPAH